MAHGSTCNRHCETVEWTLMKLDRKQRILTNLQGVMGVCASTQHHILSLCFSAPYGTTAK